jgi:hypothetical protein
VVLEHLEQVQFHQHLMQQPIEVVVVAQLISLTLLLMQDKVMVE